MDDDTDSIEKFDVASWCRICLNPETKLQMVDIDKYLQLYENCIGIKLTKLENVPTEFCSQCMETLEKFAEFKKKCTDSENWWKMSQMRDLQVKVPIKFENDDFGDSYDIGDLPKMENNEKPVKPNTKAKKPISKKQISKEFICDNCGNLFRHAGFFNRHKAVCVFGDEKIRNENKSVKEDKKDDKKDDQPLEFDCGLCTYKSLDSEDVECHFRKHLTNIELQCKLCDFVGIDTAHFVFHRYEHFTKKPYRMKCCDCDFSTIKRLKLQYHYRSVHLMKPGGQCTKCSSTYTTYKGFKYHINFHKTGGFICDICKSTFTTRTNIIDHLKLVHENIRKFVCETCGDRFKNMYALKGHVNAKHVPAKNIKCDHCDKIFKSEIHLKYHLREKNVICAECGKGFSNDSGLRDHVFHKHSDIRNFACDLCELKFKVKSALKAHIRTHDGLKPYQCEHCSKCFGNKQSMKRHYSVHTGVRPAKCSLCDKSFYTRKLLIQHIFKKHNGITADRIERATAII